MILVFILNSVLYGSPHCEIRCQEQVNQKLVSSCVTAYKNYVNRYKMTPEQAIARLKKVQL